jgi:hypothetical protein
VVGTAVATATEGSGGGFDLQPVEGNTGEGNGVITYEESSIVTSTNIFIVLVIALLGIAGYSMYVQKGGKGKNGKGKRRA